MRKPYFDRSKNAWYWINPAGKKTRLGTDERAAYDEWARQQQAEPVWSDRTPLADVFEAYLAATESTLAPDTWRQRGIYLYRIARELGETEIGQLRVITVTRWLDRQQPTVSVRGMLVKSLRAAMRWATDQGIISRNPLAGLRQSADPSRKGIVTPEQAAALFAYCGRARKRRPLRLLLWLLSATGARPGEIRRLEARHIDWRTGTATLPPAEHKTGRKTGRPRHVVLMPCALTLCRIAAERRPTGPLLRTSYGRPWSMSGLSQAFVDAKRATGLPESIVAYSLRHTYATRALTAGLDMLTVAQLLGHSSPAMLARHYAHLDQCSDYLRQQAGRVNPRRATDEKGWPVDEKGPAT